MRTMTAIRRLLLSAWLSYRALFTWLNPWGYLSSRVIAPVTLALLFGSVGSFTGSGTLRPVLGGALLALANAAVFGATLAVANERGFGTMALWLASPQGLLASLFGKVAVHLADGVLGATVTLTVAALVFHVPIRTDIVAPLLAVGATVACSSAGLGLTAAAAAIRWRDVFTAPNLVQLALMCLSGALLDPGRLPAIAASAGRLLPLSHAMPVALAIARGDPTPLTLLAIELLVGMAWLALGVVLLGVMIRGARARGSFDLL
jgi:ABC-2 type transport system permease protein